MKLPSFKRLDTGNFAEQFRGLIETLSVSLNIGIENLYTALNNRLSLSDNILCSVKDVLVTVNANGVPTSTTVFQIDSKITSLQGLQVIKADNVTSSTTYPSGGIFVNYTITTSGVQILHVTGLQASQQYQLRIIAWG